MSESPDNTKNALDKDFVSMLVCPLTRSPLTQEGDYLVAEVGGLRYPVLDGLPCLLIDRATLPEGIDSLEAFKQKYAEQIPE